jgi:hypothetical protein
MCYRIILLKQRQGQKQNAAATSNWPNHRLDAHAIRPGEYVTVREADGDAWTYRIVSVRSPTAARRPARFPRAPA